MTGTNRLLARPADMACLPLLRGAPHGDPLLARVFAAAVDERLGLHLVSRTTQVLVWGECRLIV